MLMSTKLRHVAMGCASAATLMLAVTPQAAKAATSGAIATSSSDGAPPASTTSAAGEGANIDEVIVTAERQAGSKAAPTKASLDQVQPESIISHEFIESVTPDVGNISTVVFIAPSISGISGNAGGIGNYFSTTMRGFPDGSYNVTYDGIAFGDTNNPTHHPNDYFPVSEIGAAVVDRGPGAAGDLGQANYGGAIHYFSPAVSDTPTALQKITYGSFNTFDSVTTLQSGDIRQLGGGKLWADFDERSSDTELSDSGGYALNQSMKFVMPADGGKFLLTAFATHAWSRYNFPDSNGPGETLQQVQAYGKNFQLTNIPDEEHYTGYNFERKQTWFTYVDLKYQATDLFSVEDQPYYYFYSNKTESSADNSGLIGVNTKPINGNDIEGYLKRNDYEVYGDVLRFAYQLPFGLLKVGGLYEGSDTYRQRAYYDLTTGAPYDLYTPSASKQPLLTAPTNCKTCENSMWHQEQVFVDFDWTPLHNLKISPGFKYVNFTRTIDAQEDSLSDTIKGKTVSVIGPILGTNTYSSPLYFLTANYKLTPFFSAYGQYATSFLIPQLSELQVPGVSLQHLQPETTTNYQTGLVYSRGPISWDADLYLIDARNTNVACNVYDSATASYEAASCNAGRVHYSGFEGQGAYLLPFGLTIFTNGSINNARQLAQAANTLTGIAGNPGQELAGTPEFTAAAGLIYRSGPWQASATYKIVGSQYVTGATVSTSNPGGELKLPSYDTINGDVAYTFLGRYQLKLQVFNLLDKRDLTNYVPSGNETALYQSNGGFYTYQSGREIDGTLSVKF
jgi:iron complex outermembrane receptor protein